MTTMQCNAAESPPSNVMSHPRQLATLVIRQMPNRCWSMRAKQVALQQRIPGGELGPPQRLRGEWRKVAAAGWVMVARRVRDTPLTQESGTRRESSSRSLLTGEASLSRHITWDANSDASGGNALNSPGNNEGKQSGTTGLLRTDTPHPSEQYRSVRMLCNSPSDDFFSPSAGRSNGPSDSAAMKLAMSDRTALGIPTR